MIVYPPCKINLGLRVIRKRPDQFHDLETVFIPVPVHDILEIIPRPAGLPENSANFSQSGIVLDADAQTNLCIKAWKILKRDRPGLPEVLIHLHKMIPAGAGLGGGSADAAHTIRLLNQMFRIGLSPEEMIAYAAELGSDCPFFIYDTPCYATGRGEILEPIAPDLSGLDLMIVNPGIHIHTGLAFQGIRPEVPEKDLRQVLAAPMGTWKDELINDFEKPVFKEHPEIGRIKEKLYEAGALYASLSGSGSTVYGLFPKGKGTGLSWPEKYFCRTVPAQ